MAVHHGRPCTTEQSVAPRNDLPRVGQLGQDEEATRDIAEHEFIDWQAEVPEIIRVDDDPETGALHVLTADALLPPDEIMRGVVSQLSARVGNLEVVLCRQDVDRWDRQDAGRVGEVPCRTSATEVLHGGRDSPSR